MSVWIKFDGNGMHGSSQIFISFFPTAYIIITMFLEYQFNTSFMLYIFQ